MVSIGLVLLLSAAADAICEPRFDGFEGEVSCTEESHVSLLQMTATMTRVNPSEALHHHDTTSLLQEGVTLLDDDLSMSEHIAAELANFEQQGADASKPSSPTWRSVLDNYASFAVDPTEDSVPPTFIQEDSGVHQPGPAWRSALDQYASFASNLEVEQESMPSNLIQEAAEVHDANFAPPQTILQDITSPSSLELLAAHGASTASSGSAVPVWRSALQNMANQAVNATEVGPLPAPMAPELLSIDSIVMDANDRK